MRNILIKIKILFALSLVLIPFLVSNLYSGYDRILAPSKELTYLIGPYGGGYFHSGISSLFIPDEPADCRTPFSSESKLGIMYGLKAFIPITDFISVSPRVQLGNISSDISRNGKSYPILGHNNQLESASGIDKLDLKLNTMDIDLLLTYSYVSLGLYAAAGPSVGLLSSSDYTLTTNLVAPAGVTYLDGSTSQTLSTGKMSNLNNLLLSVRVGIGWNYQLTDFLFLNPELLYSLPLSKIDKDSDSKIGGFLFTVGVLFSL
jgi:hypothetical protein